MDTLSYKTISLNKATVNKEWIIVDATGQSLGRLASKVAKLIRGKYKPGFTPHVDCGDNVIVVNAEKINMTGKKWTDRQLFRHTGYPGGQIRETPEDIFNRNPVKLVEKSVKGMLPRTRLGRAIFKNLYIYTGTEHGHEAQKPKELNLNTIK